MDAGAWWATVYGVTQSRTRLKQLSSSSSRESGRSFRANRKAVVLPASPHQTHTLQPEHVLLVVLLLFSI